MSAATKGKQECLLRYLATAAPILRKHRQAVRTERVAGTAHSHLFERHEFSAYNLLRLQAKWPAVANTVSPCCCGGGSIRVVESEQPLRFDVDAQFLAHFSASSRIKRFAGRQDAADRNIPVGRVDIFIRGAQVHEHVAGGIEDENVNAAMRQPPGANLPARYRANGSPFRVDNVYQFVLRIEAQAFCLSRVLPALDGFPGRRIRAEACVVAGLRHVAVAKHLPRSIGCDGNENDHG
jgi:hypothetical protein